MDNSVWEAWVKYCKETWFFVIGDKESIEAFLEWYEKYLKESSKKIRRKS